MTQRPSLEGLHAQKLRDQTLQREVGGDHYLNRSPQVTEVICNWQLPYCLGSALKYISRAGHKGDAAMDVAKAIHYLEMHLALVLRKDHDTFKGKKDSIE